MRSKPDKNDVLIGQAIRRVRLKESGTQEWLAKLWGCKRENVSDIERGVTRAGTTRLQILADICGVSITSLLPPVTRKARIGIKSKKQ